jgi:hypothetical protein
VLFKEPVEILSNITLSSASSINANLGAGYGIPLSFTANGGVSFFYQVGSGDYDPGLLYNSGAFENGAWIRSESLYVTGGVKIGGTLCGLTAGQIGMGSATGLTPSAITQDASNVVITGRNVGINCTPLTKFHVKVTTDENFKIQGHDDLTDGVTLVSGNDVANAYKSMEFAASQFDFVNGEVGINCTPTRKLTVSGGALVDSLVATQSFTISGVQTAAAPGTLTPTCSRIKVTGGAGTYTLAAGTLPQGTMIFIYEDNGNTGVIIAGNYHSITLNTDTGVWAVRNATGWSLQMPAL